MNITKKQLQVLCGSRIVTMKYIKKDGTETNINGRLGVVKHIKGSGKSSSRSRPDMITFYKNRQGYRSLYIDKIKELRFNGHTIK